MMKGDRFLKLVEDAGELEVTVLASSKHPMKEDFTAGSNIVPGIVSEEFQERLRVLGSQIPQHRKYPYVESIPPVVLTHSTDPLFKVTLGLAMMCGVIAGFMVGYLLVL